jgi:hypothetical protein
MRRTKIAKDEALRTAGPFAAMKRRILWLSLGLSLLGLAALAMRFFGAINKGSGAPNAANIDVSPHRDMPWHLVDVLRSMSVREPFDSLEVDVEFYDEPPSSPNFFFVPINACFNERGCYFGAITNEFVPMLGQDSAPNSRGGFVFTRWGDKDRQSIRPALAGVGFASDHEGDLVTVRARYPWTKGRYTFSLEKSKNEGDSKSGDCWVNAYVYAQREKKKLFVGALRFPGSEFRHTNKLIGAFAEVFDQNPKERIREVTSFRIGMGDVRIDGMTVTPERLETFYENGVPVLATAQGKDDSSVQLSELKQGFRNEKGAFLISLGNVGNPSDRPFKLFP